MIFLNILKESMNLPVDFIRIADECRRGILRSKDLILWYGSCICVSHESDKDAGKIVEIFVENVKKP